MSKLAHLPVSIFTSVMGLAGLGLAYRQFESVFGFAVTAGGPLLFAACLVFVLAAAAYGYKLVRYPAMVKAEFSHPVKASFFAAISINLMLLSMVAPDHFLSKYLWGTGAAMHFAITVTFVARWIASAHELASANPSWFIPVVGNIVAPVAGVGFADKELLWFFFSIGVFFWLVLFTIVFYRVVFHPDLPPALKPTLCIFLAPPSLSFVSYIKLGGTMDAPARVLAYLAVFFFFVLLAVSRQFYGLRFALSWWAFTFPLCAAAIAVVTAFGLTGWLPLSWLAAAMLALATAAVIAATAGTLNALRRGQVCVPD